MHPSPSATQSAVPREQAARRRDMLARLAGAARRVGEWLAAAEMVPGQAFHAFGLENLPPLANRVVVNQQNRRDLAMAHAAIEQSQRVRPPRQPVLGQTVPAQFHQRPPDV